MWPWGVRGVCTVPRREGRVCPQPWGVKDLGAAPGPAHSAELAQWLGAAPGLGTAVGPAPACGHWREHDTHDAPPETCALIRFAPTAGAVMPLVTREHRSIASPPCLCSGPPLVGSATESLAWIFSVPGLFLVLSGQTKYCFPSVLFLLTCMVANASLIPLGRRSPSCHPLRSLPALSVHLQVPAASYLSRPGDTAGRSVPVDPFLCCEVLNGFAILSLRLDDFPV